MYAEIEKLINDNGLEAFLDACVNVITGFAEAFKGDDEETKQKRDRLWNVVADLDDASAECENL